jgi:hypothetical protein
MAIMTRDVSAIRNSFNSVAAMVLMLPLAGATAQQPAGRPAGGEQEMSYWMKKKLEHSQNILAGIADGDFEKIVVSTESMRSLSKVEGFIRGRTPGYRTQLQIFAESADEIARQANKDNLEGAALAFTQLTISCVNCHKQLRDADK